MFIRAVLISSTFLCTLVLAADPRDKECQDWTKQAIENPALGCEGACSQAMTFDKYDYHSGLVAAQVNTTGLEGLFRYVGKSTILGAGSDEMACHLLSLLVKWGDDAFARSLLAAGRKSKVRVVGLLDYAAVPDFKTRFPKIYGLVPEHED